MKRKANRQPARRAYKRRRAMTRRIPRAPRAPRAPGVMLKRTNYVGNWTFGTATTNDFWRYLAYDMTSFNAFAEFAAVFDEYKVNAIKVTFRPAYDSTLPDTVGIQAYAHTIIDPGSTLLPSGTYNSTALNIFLQNDGVKSKTLNKPFSVYYKPKVLDQVFSTGTAGALRSSPWVRTTETGPVYRGFHMFLQQNNFGTANTQVKLDMFVTYYISFRNIR